jgi:hypothetical protein
MFASPGPGADLQDSRPRAESAPGPPAGGAERPASPALERVAEERPPGERGPEREDRQAGEEEDSDGYATGRRRE